MQFTRLNPDLSLYHTILFSDIDGVFADHRMNYGHGKTSFKLLNNAGVLLVLVSSKPVGSILEILKNCDAIMPFVFENGAGIFLPEEFASVRSEMKVDGLRIVPLAQGLSVVEKTFKSVLKRFPEIKLFFPDMPRNFKFLLPKMRLYFQHWSDKQIYDGVTPKKYFDLAFRFDINFQTNEEIKNQFIYALKTAGLQLHIGGLFHHATIGADKGVAVNKFISTITKICGKSSVTYAIGDRGADMPMLGVVDHGFLVRTLSGKFDVKKDDSSCISLIDKVEVDGFLEVRDKLLRINRY